MDWVTVFIVYPLFMWWMLSLGRKSKNNKLTWEELKSLGRAVRFPFRYKKYIQEKYFEQEGTRESNQQLRQKSH